MISAWNATKNYVKIRLGISTRNIESFHQIWAQKVCLFQSWPTGDLKFVSREIDIEEIPRYATTTNNSDPTHDLKISKTKWRRSIRDFYPCFLCHVCCDKYQSGWVLARIFRSESSWHQGRSTFCSHGISPQTGKVETTNHIFIPSQFIHSEQNNVQNFVFPLYLF